MRSFCRRKAHIFSLVLLALAGAMAAARIGAQQPTADQGVLLLRNGQMIEGRITFSEDHYLVESARRRDPPAGCGCRVFLP